jgi:3D (Asp-Asp-Asp) domain-containing protein
MQKFIITFGIMILLLIGGHNSVLAATNTYTVKSGDTLYKISKTYKVTVIELKQWNHLKSDTIHPKQKLIVSIRKVNKPAKKTTQKVVKVLKVSASAYTVNCRSCSGITATGINLKKHPNQKVISVDPKVIKLGTKVYVEGYGYAIAADKGSSIKGNKIDIFLPSNKAALKWGRRTVKVMILK